MTAYVDCLGFNGNGYMLRFTMMLKCHLSSIKAQDYLKNPELKNDERQL